MLSQINYKIIKQKNIALQAQVNKKSEFYIPSSDENVEGSATVEAAFVLPFFLCAICTVCVIGQFFLSEAAIYHATVQTARIYAKQESALMIRKSSGKSSGDSSQSKTDKTMGDLGRFLETSVIFHRFLDKCDANTSYVYGGKAGILVKTDMNEQYCSVSSSYFLRVPVPFFQHILLSRKVTSQLRLFTGYIPGSSENAGDKGQNVVYVAKNGGVYHTRIDCYHLCVTITDPAKVKSIMNESKYKKCKKCMNSSSNPSQVYISKEGDCYHSSLSCSGLKREVSAIDKNKISGMRMCSECARH